MTFESLDSWPDSLQRYQCLKKILCAATVCSVARSLRIAIASCAPFPSACASFQLLRIHADECWFTV